MINIKKSFLNYITLEYFSRNFESNFLIVKYFIFDSFMFTFRPTPVNCLIRYKLQVRIYHHHHYHHHVVPIARISLTLSRHFSLSVIASGRSSGLHPVSSHSCWMYVRVGRPAFAQPCVGVHKSTSLMSSSLLLQQCPACLARLTWIVFVIGGRWPYSWCLVGVLSPELVQDCSQRERVRVRERELKIVSIFFFVINIHWYYLSFLNEISIINIV